MPGGGQVLDYVTQRFIEGDFFWVAPAFDFSGEDFADFSYDVGVVDEACGFGV